MNKKYLNRILFYIKPFTSTYRDQDHCILSLFKENQAYFQLRKDCNNIFSLALLTFNYNIFIFLLCFPNELIICLLYIYLHTYCIIMNLYIGVHLFMFFPLFTINHPPLTHPMPLHRVSLGHRVWIFTSTQFLIYIFSFKCNHMFDGVHNAYCSSNIWGFKVKGCRCTTWRDASLINYPKTMPYLT
jgi:hypothetical protein